MAGSIAKAYVQVIPSAQGIKGKLSGMLGGEASAAGDSAGGSFASSLISKAKGLIAAAGLTVITSNLFFPALWQSGNWLGAFNWKGIVLAVVLWCLTNVVKKTKKWHPIVFIGISALVGILFQMG